MQIATNKCISLFSVGQISCCGLSWQADEHHTVITHICSPTPRGEKQAVLLG